jgi:uncharacterized membrane protein YczE
MCCNISSYNHLTALGPGISLAPWQTSLKLTYLFQVRIWLGSWKYALVFCIILCMQTPSYGFIGTKRIINLSE